LGNVSTVTDMLTGTPEVVEAAAAKCHQICGAYHIVGAGCELSPFTPPENVHAMVRFAHQHKPVPA
jgi:uroporphyrinogen-III decarboxylase